jgi:hypothetical protein
MMTDRQEVLRLVQDLLRTPGAREVRVSWICDVEAGPTRYGQTFNTMAPPSHVHHIAPLEGAEEVTVYLEGHLAGTVPCTSMIRHINGRRARAGFDPLPASTDVVRSAATGYLLRTRAGSATPLSPSRSV